GDAAFFINAFEKILRNDTFERFRKSGADFVLLLPRENVNDPVHRLGRAWGVKRAQHQMPRARRHQRQLDGLKVAQLADEDDVWILAQCPAQSGSKRLGMNADLAMIDEAVFALVNEFYWVFDRDNVVA